MFISALGPCLAFYRSFYKKHFFLRVFTIFFAQNKAKRQYNTIYSIGGLSMRKPRILEALAWYWIVTAINRHEPLFLDRTAVDLFNRVLREAGKRFAIEVRHIVIYADRVSFCIKPADGFMLPIVMQWIKQTFAAGVCEAASRRVQKAVKAGNAGCGPVSGASTANPAANAEGSPYTGKTAQKGG
jgi:hypothetical protein